jgi:hypothetical protein
MAGILWLLPLHRISIYPPSEASSAAPKKFDLDCVGPRYRGGEVKVAKSGRLPSAPMPGLSLAYRKVLDLRGATSTNNVREDFQLTR